MSVWLTLVVFLRFLKLFALKLKSNYFKVVFVACFSRNIWTVYFSEDGVQLVILKLAGVVTRINKLKILGLHKKIAYINSMNRFSSSTY